MPLHSGRIWGFPKVGASDVSSLIVAMLGIHSSAKVVESKILRGGNCCFMQCAVQAAATLPSPSVPSAAAAGCASSSDPQTQPTAVSGAAVQSNAVVGQKRKKENKEKENKETMTASVKRRGSSFGGVSSSGGGSGSGVSSPTQFSFGGVSSSGGGSGSGVSSPTQFAVGDRVEARFDNDKGEQERQYYPGYITVSPTAGAALYTISFDDGETDDKVPPADIRLLKTTNSDASRQNLDCTLRAQPPSATSTQGGDVDVVSAAGMLRKFLSDSPVSRPIDSVTVSVGSISTTVYFEISSSSASAVAARNSGTSSGSSTSIFAPSESSSSSGVSSAAAREVDVDDVDGFDILSSARKI